MMVAIFFLFIFFSLTFCNFLYNRATVGLNFGTQKKKKNLNSKFSFIIIIIKFYQIPSLSNKSQFGSLVLVMGCKLFVKSTMWDFDRKNYKKSQFCGLV